METTVRSYDAAMPFRTRYFNQEYDELNDQQKFIEILMHGNHNGFVTRIRKGKLKPKYSTADIRSIQSYSQQYDTYMTINTFKKPDKVASNIRAITTLYLDLDKHTGTRQEIKKSVQNTVYYLQEAFSEGILPRPTMMTSTGRGLGCFYVLEQPIAVSGNPKAKKSRRYFEHIYRDLARKYEDVLGEYPDTLEMDSVVINDVSRIVRMPMTYNQNAKEMCRLLDVNAYVSNGATYVRYWNLSELQEYLPNWKDKEEKKKQDKPKRHTTKVYSFEAYRYPFLMRRMRQLEVLVEIRNQTKKKNTMRELILFYYFNSAVQITDNAEELLYYINEQFREPLDESEVIHVMKSVRAARPFNTNETGHYVISDKTMIRNLALTEYELDVTKFGYSKRKLEREAKREVSQNNRNKRNQMIAEAIEKNPDQTYEELAGFFGVSLRTIKRIAKLFNIHRYNSSTVIEASEIPETSSIATEEKCQKMSASLWGGMYKGVPAGGAELVQEFLRYYEHSPSIATMIPGQLRFCFDAENRLVLST